jgi:RNA polymerase sigma-70 factor (ECF subfamily)
VTARAVRYLFADQTPILNYLYRLLGDPALAEDLTQTFTRVESAGPIARLEPAGWLTALPQCRPAFRPAVTWLPLLGDEPALATEGMEEHLAETERMRRALQQLSPDYRIPLVLYTCQAFTVAEIAAALGLSTDAVKQRLARARKQLRKAYQ